MPYRANLHGIKEVHWEAGFKNEDVKYFKEPSCQLLSEPLIEFVKD